MVFMKAIVGFSILTVWLINPKKTSKWRGGSAATISEEFEVYGLPSWSVYVVGFCKVTLSVLLLLSIKYTGFQQYAAFGLAFFLSGSIVMHLKIKDPLFKSLPAATFLILSLIIALFS